MSNKLQTFKQYYLSVKQLREAAQESPKIWETYSCRKYCKIPILTDGVRDFVSLKPKDDIKILWERSSLGNIIRSVEVVLEDQTIKVDIDWNHEKILKWLENNTKESKTHVINN